MKYICPLITVTDMPRARHFYENVMGMKVIADFGENVTYEGDFAIHLRSHFQNLINGKEIKHAAHSFEIYFEHDDLDTLQETLKSHDVKFLHEVREQPWKQKVLRIYDPDENIIEIGESLPYLAARLSKEGMTIAEIAKATYVPISLIETWLKK